MVGRGTDIILGGNPEKEDYINSEIGINFLKREGDVTVDMAVFDKLIYYMNYPFVRYAIIVEVPFLLYSLH